MKAPFQQAAVAVAALGFVIAACSPGSEVASLQPDLGGLLPAGAADALAQRRMNVIWAPEMTTCAVCTAPVAEGLARFAADYPETGVVTALVSGAPFPTDLVVGKKVVVAEPETSESRQGRRPYLAILDADRQLLVWRRIPEFGLQGDFVYQDLLGAYSLTAPLE